MLELYDLRNNFIYYHDFYIIAKEKSYSQASRKHNISQSSLSRSIFKLEELLGLKLVYTNNKGFELTIDGERLYQKLEAFFHSVDLFTAQDLVTSLDVVLTIGTTRNIADFALCKYLTQFHELYPHVKYKIYTDNASNLNELLISHKIDILIDYLPHINYNTKFGLEIRPLEMYHTCFACSKSYYEKVKDSIFSLKDLEHYPLVISGSSRRRQMLDEILQKNNVLLSPKHLMPDSKLMADFIKKNDCIGYFIEDEVEAYGLVKIEIKEELPVNPIGVIYYKDTINRMVKDFIKKVLFKNE